MNMHPRATTIAAQAWLVFELAGQHYAAALSHVSEVIHAESPTPVPGAAADVLGICQLRGRIVPVLDGRRRLGLAGEQAAVDPRIVIFSVAGQRIGMRVDAVGDLLQLEPAQIGVPPPGRESRSGDPVLAAAEWQGGFVALLDVASLCRVAEETTDAA